MKTVNFVYIFLFSALFLFSACEKEDMDSFELPTSTHTTHSDHFKNNIPSCRTIGTQPFNDGRIVSRSSGLDRNFWDPQQIISIRIFGGTQKVQDKIKQYARQWEEVANINFEFVNTGDADIRIGFNDPGYWSEIGTVALNIPQDTMTMNFEGFNDDTSEETFRKHILHEFGHALGLIHEQQHIGADIQWDREAVYDYYAGEPNNWNRGDVDINVLNPVPGQTNYSAYDSKSIMHYYFPSSLTLNDHSFSYNTRLSIQDKRYISMIYPKQTNWTTGWTIAEFYEVKGKNYAFFLKTDEGRMSINEVNDDGTIGETVVNENWATGWTSAVFYQKGSKTYALFLKKETGRVTINEVNDDGTIGQQLVSETWSSGWTTIEIYKKGDNGLYVFFLKEDTGEVSINRINSDGTIGEAILDEDWSAGWTSVQFYKIAGKTFAMFLKESTGRVAINRINIDATIGEAVLNEDWTTGWTQAKVYKSNGKLYCFFLKESTGEMTINEINSDGTIGQLVYNNNKHLSTGMTTAAFYEVDDQAYCMTLSKDTGLTHFYTLR